MAKKGSFSKVYDKNGDYADVEAVRFDGTRTVQIQGDVTASQTWNGDPSSPLMLNASIGAKKVTTDKINDKAVQTGQIDDGAVGLPQIATNAMNGTVQDNDSKLATHAAVKTYVDAQISGQGTYLGKHTVAEINAMVTDGLHNGDRVMTSDSGTVNLGPGGVGFDVEVGEDLILYKSGSTVQWDSMDGNFKTKQTAVSDPTASGTGMTFIDSIFQNENGEISATKKTVTVDSTYSSTGTAPVNGTAVAAAIGGLDSNKTSTDGTNVQVKVTETDGKISAVNVTTDNTENKNNKVTAWSETTTDAHYPSEKLVKDSLDAKANADEVVAIADAMVTRVGQNGSGWYKLAELKFPNSYDNVNCCFDVYAATDSKKFAGRLDVAIRKGPSMESSVGIRLKKFYSDAWLSDYKFKIAIRGLTGSATIELWASCLRDYGGIAISERNTSNFTANNKKEGWTYTSYVKNGGSAAPVTDATNNVNVVDVDMVYRQLAIASPTNDNLVAMDANGLVKDSGVAVLASTSTWDGTSDANVPTAKAVQERLDGKQESLSWMNDSDAVAIWNDAKTAAANAS